MNDSTLLIAGSIAVDTIETPFSKMENVLGGSVTYALAAACGFANCHIVGIVGRDFPPEGQKLYNRLAANLDDLQYADGNTFSWGGKYSANWNDRTTLFTDLGVFADFIPTLSKTNKSLDAILLANIHPVLQSSIIGLSNPNKLIVLDTMNLWIETTREELDNVLKKIHILLINESEAELLTGLKDPIQAGRKLLKDEMKMVVVKLGSKGAIAIKKEGQITVGAFPVNEVVDPTGAGDVFAGTFTAVLASGGTDLEALIKASAFASVCVEGFGVEPLLNKDRAELQKRISYLKQTVIL